MKTSREKILALGALKDGNNLIEYYLDTEEIKIYTYCAENYYGKFSYLTIMPLIPVVGSFLRNLNVNTNNSSLIHSNSCILIITGFMLFVLIRRFIYKRKKQVVSNAPENYDVNDIKSIILATIKRKINSLIFNVLLFVIACVSWYCFTIERELIYLMMFDLILISAIGWFFLLSPIDTICSYTILKRM